MFLVSLPRVCVLSYCTISSTYILNLVFTADNNNCLSVIDKKINHAWISQTGDNKKKLYSYVIPLFRVCRYILLYHNNIMSTTYIKCNKTIRLIFSLLMFFSKLF